MAHAALAAQFMRTAPRHRRTSCQSYLHQSSRAGPSAPWIYRRQASTATCMELWGCLLAVGRGVEQLWGWFAHR